MKLIVLLILLSSSLHAQDILLPRNVAEKCRENYDKVAKYREILIDKDSIINNRDKRIEVTDYKVDMLKDAFNLLNQVSQNKDTLIANKEQEIKIRVKQRNKLTKAVVGLSILEIITLTFFVLLL